MWWSIFISLVKFLSSCDYVRWYGLVLPQSFRTESDSWLYAKYLGIFYNQLVAENTDHKLWSPAFSHLYRLLGSVCNLFGCAIIGWRVDRQTRDIPGHGWQAHLAKFRFVGPRRTNVQAVKFSQIRRPPRLKTLHILHAVGAANVGTRCSSSLATSQQPNTWSWYTRHAAVAVSRLKLYRW